MRLAATKGFGSPFDARPVRTLARCALQLPIVMLAVLGAAALAFRKARRNRCFVNASAWRWLTVSAAKVLTACTGGGRQ